MPQEVTQIETPKTILIVEDSIVQTQILMDLLEQVGLKVISAINGRVGVIMARRYQPDLIIMDVQMPEMDGLACFRRLKEDQRTSGIPIVLFTAHDESEIVREGFEEGVLDFIPKDAFSEIVLLETLRQLRMLPQQEL